MTGEHKPGEAHEYDLACRVCGQPGVIRLTIDPQYEQEAHLSYEALSAKLAAAERLLEELWLCPSCHRPCVSEGMCQTCGIFALRYESMPTGGAQRHELNVERLARAIARIAEVGASHTPDEAEEHWESYRKEAEDYAREYCALAAKLREAKS